jgi:hypothetical protein
LINIADKVNGMGLISHTLEELDTLLSFELLESSILNEETGLFGCHLDRLNVA